MANLEKQCMEKEADLTENKTKLIEVNLQWETKLKMLEHNQNDFENNILSKMEQELDAKTQHLVVCKRDISSLKEKLINLEVEKKEREEDNRKVMVKTQEYIEDMKKREVEAEEKMGGLEERFVKIINGKQEKIERFGEELAKVKKELGIANKVIRGEY